MSHLLHASDTPAGVMGQFPQDVKKSDTGFSAAPDLREPASPGRGGYTVNPSSAGHRLASHHSVSNEPVSSVKHAADALKEDTDRSNAGRAGQTK